MLIDFRMHCLLAVATCCLLVLASGTLPSQEPPSDPPAEPPAEAEGPPSKPAAKTGDGASGPAAGEKPAPSKPAPKPVAPPKKKFYELPRYDLVTLDKANDDAELQVVSLPFRKTPEKSAQVGKLLLRLLENPNEEYEVMWRNVDHIVYFEDLIRMETEKIVAKGQQLSTAGKFGEAETQMDLAYDYYAHLLKLHPETDGLQHSVQSYLYANAGILFKRKHVPEAFAVLEELYAQNANYGNGMVVRAMEAVGENLIKGYVDRGDYLGARMILERLEDDYQDQLAVIGKWRDLLRGVAAKARDTASEDLKAKRLSEAYDTSREMLRVWPRIEGGRELIIEIARQYPLIQVGVSQPALAFDPESLSDRGARRCGHLMYRTLMQYVERGPEGGMYSSPYGTVRQSDDRTEMIFTLLPPEQTGGVTSFELSRYLLSLADPNDGQYRASWASLMAGLQLDGVGAVRIRQRRPHMLPHALLQTRLPDGFPKSAPYASISESEGRFEPLEELPNGERAPVVIEHYFAEPHHAIESLRKGKIDMIDRILPNDALRMMQDPNLEVGTYAFPTLHVLIPNPENPFLDNRTFRRALVYGINREVILNKGLLNGAEIDGCRVVSAPFPTGVTANDPSAYAYDNRIKPLPYDPVMAAILMGLTDKQLAAAADQKEEPAPILEELVLAHPTGELPRFVCRQIKTQLDIPGIKLKLQEMPPGHSIPPDGKYDLLYAELVMREPLVDVARVFGSDGPAPSRDPYVGLALRQVEEADNWKDAQDRLHELHRLAFDEVTAIPLWQMVDHFVYHRGLRNVLSRPVYFYQNVENWRVIPPEMQE